MVNGRGVSRGDRNRNARLARLRELLLLEVAIDLADKKQMVVVTDHDSKVLARKTFRCRPRTAGEALRQLHRPHQAHRTGPTRTAAGGLARGLGSPTHQHRLRRQIPPPHHPRDNKLTPTQAQTVIAAVTNPKRTAVLVSAPYTLR